MLPRRSAKSAVADKFELAPHGCTWQFPPVSMVSQSAQTVMVVEVFDSMYRYRSPKLSGVITMSFSSSTSQIALISSKVIVCSSES